MGAAGADLGTDVPMVWRTLAGLRWGMTAASLVWGAAAVGLVVSSAGVGDVLLAGALAMIVAVFMVIPAWRGLIAVDGETLTVRVGVRATRRIERDEITRIEPSDYGVYIEYLRTGRKHSLIAEAGQGGLNSLGARVLRRSSRSDEIAQRLGEWWQGSGNSSAGHPAGS